MLIFVYNADSGAISALRDAAHKLLAPASYPCSLCAVTYGAVAMRRDWKAWVRAQAPPPRFFHRDDFARAWPAWRAIPLPAVLIEREGMLATLLGPERLATLGDVPALIGAIEAARGARQETV